MLGIWKDTAPAEEGRAAVALPVREDDAPGAAPHGLMGRGRGAEGGAGAQVLPPVAVVTSTSHPEAAAAAPNPPDAGGAALEPPSFNRPGMVPRAVAAAAAIKAVAKAKAAAAAAAAAAAGGGGGPVAPGNGTAAHAPDGDRPAHAAGGDGPGLTVGDVADAAAAGLRGGKAAMHAPLGGNEGPPL